MFSILIAHTPIVKPDAAVFDFDGTLSKLRAGWESVMEPLMEELIPGEKDEVRATVKKYIDESTGIQTIHQMRWIAEEVTRRGGKAGDPWEYKAEYNRRLMQEVGRRREAVLNGNEQRENYMVAGSEGFLNGLRDKGVKMYAASGTNEDDVRAEAKILGFDRYFDEITGAGKGTDICSKEAVLKQLIKPDCRLLVVGDGKVEIALGRECGALTLGVASNDIPGCNKTDFDESKYKRLQIAGAHAVTADFSNHKELLQWI